MDLLAGKGVVITGAGRGLGRAYALDAAAHGAAVVVNDVDRDKADEVVAEIQAAGGKAVADAASVADWSAAEAMITRCVDAFGRIDGLVNNAGLFYVTPPWDDDEQRMRRLIEVNVLGTLFCATHALRRMKAQGGGSIVNITSGAHAGIPSMAAYGASKGAAASYTYSAAMDAAPFGVRVNAVSPIGTTRMGLAQDGGMSDELELTPEAERDLQTRRPRLVPPERVSPLVTFLLSDLSAGVTGQVIRLEDRQLGLVGHPVVLQPVEEREGWTPELVAEAFRTNFDSRLCPVGHGVADYRRPSS